MKLANKRASSLLRQVRWRDRLGEQTAHLVSFVIFVRKSARKNGRRAHRESISEHFIELASYCQFEWKAPQPRETLSLKSNFKVQKFHFFRIRFIYS